MHHQNEVYQLPTIFGNSRPTDLSLQKTSNFNRKILILVALEEEEEEEEEEYLMLQQLAAHTRRKSFNV